MTAMMPMHEPRPPGITCLIRTSGSAGVVTFLSNVSSLIQPLLWRGSIPVMFFRFTHSRSASSAGVNPCSSSSMPGQPWRLRPYLESRPSSRREFAVRS
jgi:hypothetical protein